MFKKAIFLYSFFSLSLVWAECTPDTIQFYLDKGFNQEQITKLCSQSSNSAPSYQPYQKPVVIVQEGLVSGNTAEERKAVNDLRGSIDGRSVEVTDTSINYIRKVCIRAGNSPEKEQRVDKCTDVAFSISRDGLQVVESGSAFLLFGQESVAIVSSNIKRKHVTSNPWSGFPPDIQFQLERKYTSQESGNNTDIPIRRSSTPSQVVNAVRTLSSLTAQKKSGTTDSEVAKILNDDYVPPTEEEYIASQPTLEEIKEEKKKRKKWWNPFD